ncbi:MAG: hypothetical protein KAV87_68435, partial [Desulfobacteraceae bacterium]|nr:hypothetical protein [Desulfobacteraceae bacterium]
MPIYIVSEDFKNIQCTKTEWNRILLESVHPNIFQTWEWMAIWWKWFGKGRELKLIVLKEGVRALAILPLYLDKVSIFPGLGLNVIKYIGDGGPVYPDYLGPILAD